MLLKEWMLNLPNSKAKKRILISFPLNSDFLEDFLGFPPKLCIGCFTRMLLILEIQFYYKCAMNSWYKSIEQWEVTNSTFSHITAIFNYALGRWLSWKLEAFWRSLMTVLGSLWQRDSPHQATPTQHTAGGEWEQSCPCRGWGTKTSVVKSHVQRLEIFGHIH